MTVCQDSTCEHGGNGTCCHECGKYDECRDVWKCDDPTFYEDCKDGGGICIDIEQPNEEEAKTVGAV